MKFKIKIRRPTSSILVIGPFTPGCGPEFNGCRIHRSLEHYISCFKRLGYPVILLSTLPIQNSAIPYCRNPKYNNFISWSDSLLRFVCRFTLIAWAAPIIVLPLVIYLFANRVKIIVGIQPKPSLVLAGNLLKIRVCDLLHGYGITADHKMYGHHKIDINSNFLPTSYVALDRASQYQIKKWADIKGILVHSVVSPQHTHGTKITDLSKAVDLARKKKQKIIVLTLQWGIDRFEPKFKHFDGDIHPLIIDLLEFMKKEYSSCYMLIVRPHPVLWRNDKVIKKLSNLVHSLNGVLDTNREIAPLLGKVDAHLTIFSSAVREFALYGSKSFIFSTEDERFHASRFFLRPEIEYGMAYRVSAVPPPEMAKVILSASIERNSAYLKDVAPDCTVEDIASFLLKEACM